MRGRLCHSAAALLTSASCGVVAASAQENDPLPAPPFSPRRPRTAPASFVTDQLPPKLLPTTDNMDKLLAAR